MNYSVGIPWSSALRVERIVSAFHSHLSESFYYDGEEHEGWEFVYVEDGQIMAKADDRSYVLKKGELVCHKPREFHAIAPYHGSADVIIFCFTSSNGDMQFFNDKILFVTQRQKSYLHDIAAFGSRVFLPKDPLLIGEDGGMDPDERAPAELIQMLFNTLELLILSLMSSDGTRKEKRVESYALHLQRKTLTANIRSYLEENLHQKILLSDISRHVSYSPSTLKRIFREETGSSIMQYLCDIRIERAKELLVEGMNVTEVAQEVGFETLNYFSTVFKKKAGISPGAYRERKKNKVLTGK